MRSPDLYFMRYPELINILSHTLSPQNTPIKKFPRIRKKEKFSIIIDNYILPLILVPGQPHTNIFMEATKSCLTFKEVCKDA